MLQNPEQKASLAGLRYVSDEEDGILRKRWGRGYTYRDSSGNRITDKEILVRIKELVIPPAWTKVWICFDPRGHIQAVGRDARNRKQYIYHPEWTRISNLTKFDDLLRLAEVLPLFRENVHRDLSRPGISRRKVLALAARLLETTLVRVGSDKYARENKSFGLTTLLQEHVDHTCPGLCLSFRGKRGKDISVPLDDVRLIRIILQIQEIPGQRLFQYIDEEGNPLEIDSADLNEYLGEVTGREITAKDFRTWGGTVLAAKILAESGVSPTKTGKKKSVVAAVKEVARNLNNTPAICRKYYIHPAVLEAYEAGRLEKLMEEAHLEFASRIAANGFELQPEERCVVAILRQSYARPAE